MATTIDTLQIEIQSSSMDAVKGIHDLSAALAELKANGTVNVAIKNLNNLSTALRNFSNASRAANSITFFANALAKLKTVGPVGSIGNSLTKLSASLKTLDNMDISNVGPQIERVVDAVAPLSAVKAGGLNTMVNALSKIGKVTKDLDDAKIAAFAERIEKLNTVLEPLSTKMTTIQAGFRGINSSARSAGSAVREAGESVNASSLNFATLFYNVQNVVMIMQRAIQVFSQIISQAIEWDGIAARFGRGFGPQAQETYEWIQRLNDEMGINIQQFMQYSSIYATMLTGFGVAHEDATKMALGYTELTYDIWAGYNDVYKTFEEASEAVKSAIAGEVEPIRRAGFTIIESTLEQTAANHGLEISLTNATEAQKSYLRYLTLVDQAHAQSLVGTYAKELNTAEGLMRTFSQQLKSLTQAFGSLFMPVLARVMPYLQAFVELLGEAVHWLAGLFGVEIMAVDFSGYESGAGAIEDVANSATGATDALGDAAKAAKEMKNATLGIDELNVISPPSASSGGSSSGGAGGGGGGAGFDGLDVDSLWDESIFDGIQSKVDSIKEKFKDWLPVIETIAGALAGLAVTTLITSIGEALSGMNLLQKALSSLAILTIEAALVFIFADNYLESGNLLNLIGQAVITAVSSYLMFKSWGATGIVLSLGISILAQLIALKTSLADGTVTLGDKETWIQSVFTIFTGALGGLYLSKYSGIFPKEGFRIGLSLAASLVLMTLRMGAIESKEIDSGSWEAWLLELGSVLTAALTGKFLGTTFYGSKGGPGGALIGVTAGLAMNLLTTIEAKGEDFGNNISDWINAGITAAMTAFTGVKLWGLVGPAIKSALAGILPEIGAAIGTAFTTLTTALAAIPVWGWIAAAIVALLAGAITLAVVDHDFTDIGHKIGEALGKAIGAAVNFAIDVGKAIWGGLKAAFEWVTENFELDSIDDWFNPVHWAMVIVPKMIEIGLEILPGLWEGIQKGWDNFWSNIGEFIAGFIQGFKDGFEIKSPSKVFAEIGGFLIEGLWKGIFDWISNLYSKISGFVKDTISKVKEYFGIKESSSSIFAEIGDFLIQGLWNGINNKVDWIIGKIGGWVDTVLTKVKDFFGIASPSKEFVEIGGFLVDGLWDGLKDGYTTLADNVQGWLEDLFGLFKDFDFTDALGDAWNWITGLFTTDKKTTMEFEVKPKNDSSTWWSDVKKWWGEKVGAVKEFTTKAANNASTWWSDVKKWWSEKVGSVSDFKTNVSNNAKDWWANAKKWWGEKVGSVSNFKTNVSNSSKTWWSNVKKWWSEKVGSVSNFKTGVSNSSKTWWSNVKKWWSEKVGSVASFSVNVKNNASTWWSNVKKWWNDKAGSLSTKLNISLPTIKVKWDTVSAFGKEFRYPIGFNLKFAAAGGIFDAGSLIWAGERGAEIVANAGGGKTGVMNVQQMSDAVFEGVYAAVMAANRASQGEGGGQSINVYLDGKQITATVEKRQRERGASLMGNQVYSY